MAQKHNISDTEYPMTRMGTIQQPSRRYRRLRHPSFTAAVWTANNPLLQRGEFGSEIDTGKLKIGDGVTYWNDLGYVAASEIAFADITGTPDDNVALKNALDAKQDVLTEGTGIDIDSDNIISNTGVRSVATGTTNGTISVNTGGTSAEVAVYGLGSAAYTSSSDYATAAQGILADNAANKDLSNLTSTGANIGNWSSNVTNCITEIPQDIKLELAADGTLTLKSGSKVYVPNGSGTFDTVTTTADVSVTRTDSNKCMVWRYSAGNLGIFPISLFYSGATAPTQYTFMFWYDTTNNLCKVTSDGGSTWISGVSFPLCIVSTDGTKISAIDRIFNGFGYVGRSIFSLPGIRVLRPAGRNDDGTLKNDIGSIPTVAVRTFDTTDNFDKVAIGWWGGFSRYDYNNWTYNEIENRNYISGTIWNWAVIGTIKLTNGVISEFNIKTPFHAVDYNDSDYIANCAMPSGKYIDLTLPANGGNVTAPADGYITIAKATGSVNEYVSLSSTSNIQQNACCPIAGFNIRLTIPVSKGDVVIIGYSASGTTQYFRFVYANGAK